MKQRVFRRAGLATGEVGLGTWQLGSDWGKIDEKVALDILTAAAETGVTFFDTADVYGDGRSERIIGSFKRHIAADFDKMTIATKMGRRVEQRPEHYTLDNFRAWTDRSRRNLGVEVLDLVQLHCPPTEVYASDEVFDALDTLVAEQRVLRYGVSVETCAQALAAIERPGVVSVQIIFNALRLKPLERVLPAAAAAGVGLLARVPLASGLLSGRFDESTTFSPEDHRAYNRAGQAFDVGETFSGVDYGTGLAAVRALTGVVPAGMTMAQFALRWILDHPEITAVIPGASNPGQARGNAAAAELPPLPEPAVQAVRDIYDELIRPSVHDRW
jgi:aryl-alcohol dehydrogenase-like predicted oxidoreductase